MPFDARRGTQQLDADRDPCLDGPASAADPGELVLGLDAAALVEEALVGGELDSVRAQEIGVTEREAGRSDCALEPELPARVQIHLVRTA